MRGELNNNPGNIRIVQGVVWSGQSIVQNDPSFVQFINPVYGIRAICRILRSYEREGINTIQNAIDRWAPPNENNSYAYVTDVANRCDISPTEVLSLESIMPSLIQAIIWHEEGRCIYTFQQIEDGIDLA
jgi:hypothetical protein